MAKALVIVGAANLVNTTVKADDAYTFNNAKQACHETLLVCTQLKEFSKVICYDPEYPCTTRLDNIDYIPNVVEKLQELIETGCEVVVISFCHCAMPEVFPGWQYRWIQMEQDDTFSVEDLDCLFAPGPNIGFFSMDQFAKYAADIADSPFRDKIWEPMYTTMQWLQWWQNGVVQIHSEGLLFVPAPFLLGSG